MNPNKPTNINMALPAFMNMTMGAGHNQLQQPHGTGSAPQMQLPQGMLQMQPGGPTFEVMWQGWQQGGQHWLSQVPQMAQMGQIQGAAAPNASAQPLVINDVAAFAGAMQSLLQNASSAPVGSVADDERTLIRALREGRAEGLTARQVLDKLHNVNNHSESAWKNYFLDHLDRLYPKVCRTSAEHVQGRWPPRLSITGAPSLEHLKKRATNEPVHRQAFKKAYNALAPSRGTGKSARMRSDADDSDSDYSNDVSGSDASRAHARTERSKHKNARDASKQQEESDEGSGLAVARTRKNVTKDDLRAMARYRVDSPPTLDESATGKNYWWRFARLTEQGKRRTGDGWAKLSRSERHREMIDQHIAEYRAEKRAAVGGSGRSRTPKKQDEEDHARSGDENSYENTPLSNSRKRRASEDASDGGHEEKRLKQADASRGDSESDSA